MPCWHCLFFPSWLESLGPPNTWSDPSRPASAFPATSWSRMAEASTWMTPPTCRQLTFRMPEYRATKPVIPATRTMCSTAASERSSAACITWAQYVTGPKQPLHLYHPYNNRECLHCHEGARSFEQGTTHNADPEIMQQIRDNKMSCLSSGCHETIHNVAQLNNVKYWKPQHPLPSYPK